MKPLSSLISIASMLLTSFGVQADKTSECSQIEDTRARLLCFDREFPNASAPTSEAVVPEISGSSVETVSIEDRDNIGRKSRVENRISLGGIFDRTKSPEIETEIVAIRSGDKQRMVFRLRNGQIWMQATPRHLPFSIGDKVVIKGGTIGGHIMRSQSGTSTRVQLID